MLIHVMENDDNRIPIQSPVCTSISPEVHYDYNLLIPLGVALIERGRQHITVLVKKRKYAKHTCAMTNVWIRIA